MTTKTDIRKAELIKLITSYIVEYADCRDELSANKTAEVIYGVVLQGTQGQNCPFSGCKIFCPEELCSGCYWYDRTLELVPDHDRTLQTIIDDKVIADNMRDYWNHLGRED